MSGFIFLTGNSAQNTALTFPCVIAPTAAGPMNPGTVPIVLVIPISVPTIVHTSTV